MWWFMGIFVVLVLCWVFPRLKKFLGSMIGVLALVAGMYVLYSKYEHYQAARRIEFEQIEIVDITLQGDKLKGRVRNHSPEFTLSGIRLKVTMRDVGEGGKAKIVAESSRTIRLDVPPGRSGDFEEFVLFAGPGNPQGRLQWSYELTGARGEK